MLGFIKWTSITIMAIYILNVSWPYPQVLSTGFCPILFPEHDKDPTVTLAYELKVEKYCKILA